MIQTEGQIEKRPRGQRKFEKKKQKRLKSWNTNSEGHEEGQCGIMYVRMETDQKENQKLNENKMETSQPPAEATERK